MAKLTVSVIARSGAAMRQEPDADLAYAATPSGLKTLEGYHIQYPDDRRLIATLAEATCQYGAGFLQDEWERADLAGERESAERARQRARAMFGRCVGYALKLLPPSWRQALWERSPELAKLVARAGREHVPGLFFAALGLATSIGMFPEDFALGARVPQVELLLERVIALDEGYADGLAHMTLGILHSARSAAVGGDPARGKRHLDRARALTGGRSLMVEVLMARYYAVTMRDQLLFRDALVQVLQTDPAVWPENRLANELAQRKARRYLRHESLWF